MKDLPAGSSAESGEKSPADAFLTGEIPFGDYNLMRSIGVGGMAEVYLARPKDGGANVAIKVVKKKLADNNHFIKMFIREGKLAVLLKHDAVVETFRVGRHGHRNFICMEYIPGIDLLTLFKKCQKDPRFRLTVSHALYITLRVCEGLHYAHELKDASGTPLNLVNRDVNPANIRISFDGEVKMLDFGIAKASTGLTSEIGMLKGKVRHMSPEQVRSLPVDRRSDVFSTGIVLHELLTGETLFRSDNEFQIMDLVRRAEVRKPSDINPRVPPEVDELTLKALEKRPEDRYQDAGEMAEAVRSALAQYNFTQPELMQLVRQAGYQEWMLEQRMQDPGFKAEIQRFDPELREGFYSADSDTVDLVGGEKQASQPRWIYGLLAFSIILVGAAMTLLFWL